MPSDNKLQATIYPSLLSLSQSNLVEKKMFGRCCASRRT